MKEDTEYFDTLLETATAQEADRLWQADGSPAENREHYQKLATERLRDSVLRKQAIKRVSRAELKNAL
jgi:hypothetical protein